MADNLLFREFDSFALQDHQRKQMSAEIAGLDGNRLLNTNVDDLVGYFVDKYQVEVPELDESAMSADQREAQRDVSGDPRRVFLHDRQGPFYVTGTEVTIEIPFSGDPAMFRVRPNQFTMSPPHGTVRNNTLVFQCWGTDMNPDQIRAQLNGWLAEVKQYLGWQHETFDGFNESLAKDSRDTIESRRSKLLANQNLVAGLGIPLKRRPDAPTTYTAPNIKRKLTPKLPAATTGPYKPEPVLEEAEYQHILRVIESTAKVMERTPSVFHDLDEEGIRSHFLVQLNGHYEGQATGETFNRTGKTDILIRSGDRNVFIGECKFWGGPAKMTETINQLLGYLAWRDSKTAILVFNRNKDFSKVLAAIPDVMRAHPNFKNETGKHGETGFRYIFRHKDDPAKILHLTVLAFDVPSSN